MKKFLFLAIASIMSLGASAQLISSNTVTYHKEKNGYDRVGVSYNSLKPDVDEADSNSGISLSWTKGIPVTNSVPLFVETGLTATYAFDNINGLTATIPVNVTYKIPVTDGFNIAPLAGLTFNGHIFQDPDDVNFFTLGWQAGANFEFGKFYVGVTYGGDLTNYVSNDYYDFKLNNLQATVGIVF